jgi:trans-aconitate 2-methyltransferase
VRPGRQWDAAGYDRVSHPQVAWARPVLDRLGLRGDETVLDAGCGSGRVTEMLLDRLPGGRVIAVDADAGMVAHARERLGGRARVERQDLLELDLAEPVDAAFSNAVFHWIPDHPGLFARLHAALRPGGRLGAQCGGKGNVARLRAAADELTAEQGIPPAPRPWNFAGPEETEERLRDAGFTEVRCWLEPWPVEPDEPRRFLETVCLGPHLETMPERRRAPFVEAVLARLGERPVLDYVRLNLEARRAG